MSELLESFINRMTEGGIFEMLFGKLLPSLSAVACYVFLGVALTVLSRATGIGRVWQAWVPFADLYLIGLLADVYTDNRLTTEADRARPFYRPSDLRRRTLGYGIGSSAAGAVASVGWLLCIAGGAIAFFLLLGSWAGDEMPDTPPNGGAYGGRGPDRLCGGGLLSGLHRSLPAGLLPRAEPCLHGGGGSRAGFVGAVGDILPLGRRHRALCVCRAAQGFVGRAVCPARAGQGRRGGCRVIFPRFGCFFPKR